MPKKGYISDFMGGGRIVAHGQITDLSAGFSLPAGALFTVYARPKETDDGDVDVLLNARCYQDNEFSPVPVVLNDWSPLAIQEIAPDTEGILDYVDLYWGSGEYVKSEGEV